MPPVILIQHELAAKARRPIFRGGENWIFQQLVLLGEALGESLTLGAAPGSLRDRVRVSDNVWRAVTANFEASGRQEVEWSVGFKPPIPGRVEMDFREYFLTQIFRDEVFLAEYRQESAKGRLRKVAVWWCLLSLGSDTILELMNEGSVENWFLHKPIARMALDPDSERELKDTVTFDEVRDVARRGCGPAGTTHVTGLMSVMPHRYIFVPQGNVFIDRIIEVMALSQGHDVYFVRRSPHSRDEDTDCEDCTQRMGCEQIGVRVPTHIYEAALEQYEASGARQLRDLVSELFDAPEDTRKRLWKFLCERFELLGQSPQKNTLADVCRKYGFTPVECVILGVQQLVLDDAFKEVESEWADTIRNAKWDDRSMGEGEYATLCYNANCVGVAGTLIRGARYRNLLKSWGAKGSVPDWKVGRGRIHWDPKNPAHLRLEMRLPADVHGGRRIGARDPGSEETKLLSHSTPSAEGSG
ncbi:hypothetical protein GGR57DRAFT_320652 [Xylariaceae sp. FL1272]|nr:hypothetical protein GGR57DRAFT_320652 [Xylariaceae sp. FL1272]